MNQTNLNVGLFLSAAFSVALVGIWSSFSAMRASPTDYIEQENRRMAILPENSLVAIRKLGIPMPKTEAGIDLNNGDLYSGVDLKGDSATATVMGMATGYNLATFHQFVGTLRKSGFKGNIILGVEPTVSNEILEYFKYRNVTPKIMKWVNCTYSLATQKTDSHAIERRTCAHPYPDIKLRWSRFPLQRDWLRDCDTCSGPVLVMDVRDSFFQLDPFGPGSPIVKGLQVFQEHKNQTTDHWLTKRPIKQCKGNESFIPNKPMLCSGTTVGTRAAMLKYLERMYAEMRQWIKNPNCHFQMNGDDQSIHNYLFYSSQLPFATSIANREGGIVNTIGYEGSEIMKQHIESKKKLGITVQSDAMDIPYEGAVGGKASEGRRWIGEKYNIADNEGWFTEADGTKSRVVHQFDRFGKPYLNWKNKHSYFRDQGAVLES